MAELQKLQNVMARIMQIGNSGNAVCGMLGLLSVEVTVGQRKLYLFGKLLNMSLGTLCRLVFNSY